MEENVPKQAAEPIPAPEKTKKKSPILTIIFAILALAGIGFGVYGMCFNKPESSKCAATPKEENPEEEPGDITQKDEDYTIYYDLVNKYIRHTLYDNTKVFLNEGFENINYIASVASKELEGGRTDSISKNELVEMVEIMFDYDFSKIDTFDLGCRAYKISEDGLRYEFQPGGCGGAATLKSIQTITSVDTQGEELKIDIAVAELINSAGETVSMMDKNGEEIFSKEREVTILGMDDEWNKTAEEEGRKFFEENLDEFPKFRLIFKKADKHYYLESGEKLN